MWLLCFCRVCAPASIPALRKQYKVLNVLTKFLFEPKEHLVPGFLAPPTQRLTMSALPVMVACVPVIPTEFKWTWRRCAPSSTHCPPQPNLRPSRRSFLSIGSLKMGHHNGKSLTHVPVTVYTHMFHLFVHSPLVCERSMYPALDALLCLLCTSLHSWTF